MSNTARSMVAMSVAALLGVMLSAMAQQPTDQPPPRKPAVRVQPAGPQNPTGQPARAGASSTPSVPSRQRAPTEHTQTPPGKEQTQAAPSDVQHGPFTPVATAGEGGYSFRRADHGRREITTFSERERTAWSGGHWRHERRFGRLGYWSEVNGAWYFYDRPMSGPPTYVSEVEFLDKGLAPPAAAAAVVPATTAGQPPVVAASVQAFAPGRQCPTGSRSDLVRPFVHVEGYAFKAPAPGFAKIADTDRELYRSPAVLCEDGIRMGPEHRFWSAIVKSGSGRFSHYEDTAVFSATDNSDPNANGRHYTIVVPAPAP